MHIYAGIICDVLCVFVKTVKTQKQIKYKKKPVNFTEKLKTASGKYRLNNPGKHGHVVFSAVCRTGNSKSIQRLPSVFLDCHDRCLHGDPDCSQQLSTLHAIAGKLDRVSVPSGFMCVGGDANRPGNCGG